MSYLDPEARAVINAHKHNGEDQEQTHDQVVEPGEFRSGIVDAVVAAVVKPRNEGVIVVDVEPTIVDRVVAGEATQKWVPDNEHGIGL